MIQKHVRVALIGLLALGSASCDDVTRPDPQLCEQTYEFGNTGCFQITGQVLGSLQQPLVNAYVGARVTSDSAGHIVFGVTTARTDANGRYQLRAHRMFAPIGDTVNTFRVRVSALMERPTRVADSAFTTVSVSPVGSAPRSVVVNFQLRTP